MLLRSLNIPLNVIRGIGPEMVRILAKPGIRNIAGLLCHYPRDWEDRSVTVPIKDFHKNQVCTEITVVARDWIGYGRMRTLKVYVEDESGRAVLLCFNRPWLEKLLIPGERFRLWGRFYYKYSEIQSSAFEIETIDGTEKSNRVQSGILPGILPVYPLTEGLNQKKIRSFIKRAIDKYAADLENELPENLITRDKLLSKAAAIKAIHFPVSAEELELAKKTLIYEELFYLEVMVGKRAGERIRGIKNEKLEMRNERVQQAKP